MTRGISTANQWLASTNRHPRHPIRSRYCASWYQQPISGFLKKLQSTPSNREPLFYAPWYQQPINGQIPFPLAIFRHHPTKRHPIGIAYYDPLILYFNSQSEIRFPFVNNLRISAVQYNPSVGRLKRHVIFQKRLDLFSVKKSLYYSIKKYRQRFMTSNHPLHPIV